MLNFIESFVCVCNFVLTEIQITLWSVLALGLFQLTFVALSLDKKDLASVHSVEDLENAPFQPRKRGELLLLEVPGLTRFTANHILVGLKRTVYFSSETSE